MVAAVRPLFGPLDEPVAYRVVVDVVKMSLEVVLISDDVIPEAFLPEFHSTRYTEQGLVLLREMRLERVHNIAEIALARWPDEQMKVIGQKYISEHSKRMQLLHLAKNPP